MPSFAAGARRHIKEHCIWNNNIIHNKEKLAELLLGNRIQSPDLNATLSESLNVIVAKPTDTVKRLVERYPKGYYADKVKFSLKTRDADYMSAVESGDMDTAQHMVDEAAKAAGYDVNVFHGTMAEFSRFNTDYRGAIWTTTIRGAAAKYAGNENGSRVVRLYAKSDNSLRKEYSYNSNWNIDRSVAKAIDGGYDSLRVLFKNDGLVVLSADNRRIKSADPITYDDNGNVVPLSERFDDSKRDIRFSIKENVTDVNGRTYDNVVQLEYDIFNKAVRNNRTFVSFISKNLLGKKITVYNKGGGSEIIEFARDNDRVTKAGSNNKSRRVLGELERTTGDLRKLIIVNAEETVTISEFARHSDDHSHQGLDENGWNERTAYVMTSDGVIYPATLKIAKARDGRNILYAVNVDIKTGVPVAKSGTSHTENNPQRQPGKTKTPATTLAKPNDTVKRLS